MELLENIQKLRDYVIEAEKKLNEIDYSLSRKDVLYILKNEYLIIKTRLIDIIYENERQLNIEFEKIKERMKMSEDESVAGLCSVCGTDNCNEHGI